MLCQVALSARRSGDQFVLLACDGVWDVMTSPQAGNPAAGAATLLQGLQPRGVGLQPDAIGAATASRYVGRDDLATGQS